VGASFGDLLRGFRVAASLTQEALAERARVSAAAVAALEQGKRRAPRLSTVRELADALDLSPADRAALASAATGVPTVGGNGPAARDDEDLAARHVSVAASWMAQHPDSRRSLPAPLTPLIARLMEVGALAEELAAERLITLVGSGGVGKTRLALRVAARRSTSSKGVRGESSSHR
jgi:transcriptional regulator with XRE-family HTH domain